MLPPPTPPAKHSQEPAIRKKGRRPPPKEEEQEEENGEEEEDKEDDDEEEISIPEEAKESAKSVGVAPVGQFLLNVLPRSLHTDFTDSALDEEKSFISGRVTPTLIKTGPLLRFGTIMPIRHAAVTWTPDLNDPAVVVKDSNPLTHVMGENARVYNQMVGKRGGPVEKTVLLNAGDLIVLVDSTGKRVAVREDEEKKVFSSIDKRLQELVVEHPTKSYDEMVELLEEVSGNLGDLEELLDGNDDVHQWDELEDLAVQKHKGSQEYKAIVKKLGEKLVCKRRAFLSR